MILKDWKDRNSRIAELLDGTGYDITEFGLFTAIRPKGMVSERIRIEKGIDNGYSVHLRRLVGLDEIDLAIKIIEFYKSGDRYNKLYYSKDSRVAMWRVYCDDVFIGLHYGRQEVILEVVKKFHRGVFVFIESQR